MNMFYPGGALFASLTIFSLVKFWHLPPVSGQSVLSPASAGASLPIDAPKTVDVVSQDVARNATAPKLNSTEVTANADAADVVSANKAGTSVGGTNASAVLEAVKKESATIVTPPAADNVNGATKLNGTEDPWHQTRRLAKDVIPLHYSITLNPDIPAGKFFGASSILVQLTGEQPRSFIYLHVKYLTVTKSELYRLDENDVPTNISIKDVIHFPKNEFLVLVLATPTSQGRYLLNFQFNGTMLGKNNGFYRSSYKTKTNETRYLATTQFESTDARQAFPCFDEPSFKATFNVSVIYPSNMTALSNMPQVADIDMDNGLKLARFAKSPPMVTYLVALIISDFKYIETKSVKYGIPLRAYASAEHIDDGTLQYALDVLRYSVNTFENYFGIPYALPKLDMVGIPDFNAGAMENWGLMTFRELYLVYDADEAPVSVKQDVAFVVSHEVAHQWFGDLVTTEWWDSLWLNEGFATLMEFVGITGFDPDWPLDESFITEQLLRALSADQIASSHPIVVRGLSDPGEIEELFDAIPYSKGGSTLRMLENFIGAEVFRLGVSRFLRDKAYATANSDDLWTALNQQLREHCAGRSDVACNTDIKQVMDTWILQMNYPLIHVTAFNDTHGRVRQERFLIDPRTANASNPKFASIFNYTWQVPIKFTYFGNQSDVSTILLDQTEATFEWPTKTTSNNGPPQFTLATALLFNPSRAGVYRVNYPLNMWQSIASELARNINNVPDARDRAGLVSDAFELARGGVVPYSVPFSFLSSLPNERSFAVWSTVASELSFISERIKALPEVYDLYRARIRSLVKPVLDELGYRDTGSVVQQRLRALLLTLACVNGDVRCITFSQNMFRSWLQNNTAVAPNFRPVVYTYGMRYMVDDSSWQLVLRKLLVETAPSETKLLLNSLASSSQPWQLEQLLQISFNSSYVRLHDHVSVFRTMAFNPVGLLNAWNFYRTSFARLVQRLSLNDVALGKIPIYFATSFNNQLQLDEMKNHFNKYPEAGAGSLSRQQALEMIETNINWLRKNNATVSDWLKSSSSSPETRTFDITSNNNVLS